MKMFKNVDHVGIIVKNVEEAAKLYEDMLNLSPSSLGIVTLPGMGIKIVLLPIGDMFIELIEPIKKDGRFFKHLKERGEGLFHICIFADDFDSEVEKLKNKGYKVEEEGTPELFPGFTVRLAWLSPEETNGHWIEIADLSSMPPEPGK
jgi:methylmalonyl-CoA/ethylmalonyl-CoA epimerase